MATTSDPTTGAPCWVDLLTSDPDRSRAFYGDLFGWTVHDPGEQYGGYVNFLQGDRAVGGCMRNDGQSGSPDVWTVYLSAADAAATTAAAAAHGGQVLLPAMQVMELGTMAMVADPGGAAVGVWQPGLHTGFGAVGELGTPAWFELFTRDYDDAVKFYGDVFGWKTHVAGDTPEFRYTTLGEGDDQKAGIMDATSFLPDGVPAHWSVYFRVAETDAALARAVELGATVVAPAVDTPYGRLAQAADPTGVLFKLVGDA